MKRFPPWMLLLLFCLVLVGCDQSTVKNAASKQATPSPTHVLPTATATPRPTATATPGPAVSNVYFVTYDQTMYALNSTDGSVRWKFSHGQSVSNPIPADSLVYIEVIAPTLTLYALDSATGSVVWSAPGGAFPTVSNGIVYVIVNRSLVALDGASGAVKWQRQVSGNSITVADNAVYVVDMTFSAPGVAGSSTLSALDVSDGAVKWSFTRQKEGFGRPVVNAGTLYVWSNTTQPSSPPTARLYALRTSDGTRVWDVGAAPNGGDLGVAGGVICMTSTANGIYGYRTSDGGQAWKHAVSLPERSAVFGNTLYANTLPDAVIALDVATGSQLWSTGVGSPGYMPIVANGMLYDVSASRSGGELVAINASTGRIAWERYIVGTPGPPVLVDTTIYVYDIQPDNGPSPVVYAFNARTGQSLWKYEVGQNLQSTLAVYSGLSGA